MITFKRIIYACKFPFKDIKKSLRIIIRIIFVSFHVEE